MHGAIFGSWLGIPTRFEDDPYECPGEEAEEELRCQEELVAGEGHDQPGEDGGGADQLTRGAGRVGAVACVGQCSDVYCATKDWIKTLKKAKTACVPVMGSG